MTALNKVEYTRLLLRDFHALESLIRDGKLDERSVRIGYELELNLLNEDFEPALIGEDILAELDSAHVSPEFSRFNLEVNTEPAVLKGHCFSALERDLGAILDKIRKAAARRQCSVLLTGIIPTLNKSHIMPGALTPEPRYKALHDIRRSLKGEQFEYRIQGIDELLTRDNIALFAGCGTSFQTHLQVAASQMVDSYNWAQMVAGPILAAATNSPLFLGKRLWQETRIELFEQATDTRNPDSEVRSNCPRVFFGDKWLGDSVLELLQEDIIGFEPLLSVDEVEDPVQAIAQGKAPRLDAWTAFNGSIYRWNRICYGRIGTQAALRIENRVLPSGPTLPDMVANAAFWTGVMTGLPPQYRALQDRLDFGAVKENFFKAARYGLDVEFSWCDGAISARELILDELLPIAANGLAQAGVDRDEADLYLGIIRARVETGRTGSCWMLNSYQDLQRCGTREQALRGVTAGMLERQEKGLPVHQWQTIEPAAAGDWTGQYSTVHRFMTTTLYKVKVDDIVDLVTHLMEWKRIGHIPVEDDHGQLVGMITRNTIINFMVTAQNRTAPVRASDLMITEPLTVTPETTLHTALAMMLDNKVSCLPVVNNARIVGLVTEHDIVKVAQGLVDALEKRGG